MTNRTAIGLGLALVFGLVGPAAPQHLDRIVTQPSWRTKPTPEAFMLAYPQKAHAQQMDGHVVIKCRVRVAGNLTDCQVVEELPAGYGFGASALKIATTFSMNPLSIDGVPSDDGVISIPIAFRDPKLSLIREANPIPPESSWLECPLKRNSSKRYYPEKALDRHAEGFSMVQCRLDAEGKPMECAWLSETPVSFGFGKAAEELGCLMSIKKEIMRSVGGAPLFTVPIWFRLPED